MTGVYAGRFPDLEGSFYLKFSSFGGGGGEKQVACPLLREG